MTTARDIAFALGRRVHRLADGGYLVPCPVPSHGKGRGDRSPSLSLRDGATCLLVHCYAGCDARDVLGLLRHRGLLGDGAILKPKAPAPDDLNRGEYKRQQHHKAAFLWSQRKPITGTPAEVYLRAARGITCPLPPTLGFLQPRKAGQHPGMIAAFALTGEVEPGVLAPPCNVGAVHLTLLKPDGSGKANVPNNKLMVGSPGALPITLAPPNDLLGLCITEGIEDGLTAFEATRVGVWVAGSAGQMPTLADVVPNYVEAVTIYSHADKAGQDGARRLADRLVERGIDVCIDGIAGPS